MPEIYRLICAMCCLPMLRDDSNIKNWLKLFKGYLDLNTTLAKVGLKPSEINISERNFASLMKLRRVVLMNYIKEVGDDELFDEEEEVVRRRNKTDEEEDINADEILDEKNGEILSIAAGYTTDERERIRERRKKQIKRLFSWLTSKSFAIFHCFEDYRNRGPHSIVADAPKTEALFKICKSTKKGYISATNRRKNFAKQLLNKVFLERHVRYLFSEKLQQVLECDWLMRRRTFRAALTVLAEEFFEENEKVLVSEKVKCRATT